ncbi:hypothetical protein RND81_10G182400 [Saponaria officinalis]|uniref:Uncharacterized protein n=1 Tax=Saponaria officinalis TaxID=3572 RepID=A0AAW1I570_SAPOF
MLSTHIGLNPSIASNPKHQRKSKITSHETEISVFEASDADQQNLVCQQHERQRPSEHVSPPCCVLPSTHFTKRLMLLRGNGLENSTFKGVLSLQSSSNQTTFIFIPTPTNWQ